MARFGKSGLVVMGALLAMLLVSSPAMATTISFTFPEFNGNGPVDNGLTLGFASAGYVIPAGETIISAIFSSSYGNSAVPNTSIMEVFVDSVLVGQCASTADVCWNKPAQPPTPFSHSFLPSELADLADGFALFTVHQTADHTIRLGSSVFTIETAALDPGVTATPEPASITLMAIGLAGAASAAWRRRMRPRPDA
jgi:hypothetical protein